MSRLSIMTSAVSALLVLALAHDAYRFQFVWPKS
jgi:hypothetical protein